MICYTLIGTIKDLIEKNINKYLLINLLSSLFIVIVCVFHEIMK